MKVLLVVAAVVVTLVVLFWLRRAPLYSVPVAEIPAVVARLHGLPEGKYGTWVVFMFRPPGSAPGAEAVNLQYSVEHGNVGLDWVLLSATNVADKERLTAFVEGRAFRVSEREMNNVRYLRVEGAGIDQLGVAIVTELYGIASGTPIEFHTEGLKWEKNRS